MSRYSADFWSELAAKHGFSSEAELWRGLYLGANGTKTMQELSDLFDLGYETVRRRLVANGIPIRPPGEAVPAAVVVSSEEAAALRLEGISVAAKRLSVEYFDLYRAIRRREELDARERRRKREEAEEK